MTEDYHKPKDIVKEMACCVRSSAVIDTTLNEDETLAHARTKLTPSPTVKGEKPRFILYCCSYLLLAPHGNNLVTVVYCGTTLGHIPLKNSPRDPGLPLATLKQGHVSYVAMFLLSSPYEALRYLVGKDIVFCETIAAMMDVYSLQEYVYRLEPLSCRCKNSNCQAHCLPSNPTPSQSLL
ncbi:hypothetical protein AVEN_28800-1 [Araneus ventricosus]|uniref:Uncharacterized protein n=1 Tax=Araneus ventricosus TaxID=182803 RepID=A0A4Y2IRW0_ARAVE|nr:hypothetical protein AVEN_28800-1 [Araneus ventricosus]